MDELTRMENRYHIQLPEIYRDFYNHCSLSIPPKLTGTDLRNKYPGLNEGAIELLYESEAGNFLKPDDFVFMMHQGYIFWYFKANGNPDAIVYRYYEGRLNPEYTGHLSEFLKEYIE